MSSWTWSESDSTALDLEHPDGQAFPVSKARSNPFSKLRTRLLDHGNPPKPIKRKSIWFDESFSETVASPNLVGIPTEQGSGMSNEIVLVDKLALGQTLSPLPAGSYVLRKQTIKVTFTGAKVRVNCLDFEATDVTVTDITNSPGVPCTRN